MRIGKETELVFYKQLQIKVYKA